FVRNSPHAATTEYIASTAHGAAKPSAERSRIAARLARVVQYTSRPRTKGRRRRMTGPPGEDSHHNGFPRTIPARPRVEHATPLVSRTRSRGRRLSELAGPHRFMGQE